MRASGMSGELRTGYQCAARLGAWSLDLIPRLPRAFAFRAVVLEAHDYWVRQVPLDLVLAVGRTEWIWREAVPTPPTAGGALTLELRERPIVADRMPIVNGEEEKGQR